MSRCGKVETVTQQPQEHIARLYPEVAQAGSLQAAMQAALNQAGYELSALLTESPGWYGSATTVRDDTRRVSTVLGSQQRAFLMEFWERGVLMAKGNTTELIAAAGATEAWLNGSRLAELRESWTFVHYGELAEAFERGNPTQVKWDILRRSDARHLNRELLEAAYAEPVLRMLFPFTSHHSLNLSRCTRWRYSNDLPLTGSRFTIFWANGSPYGTGHIADVETATEAVAIVQANLPADCGPAIDGTAEDLDRPALDRIT